MTNLLTFCNQRHSIGNGCNRLNATAEIMSRDGPRDFRPPLMLALCGHSCCVNKPFCTREPEKATLVIDLNVPPLLFLA
jgi:hypothetical protein